MREKVLVVFFSCLAAAWTAGLFYLASAAADPIVVSAPQLHLAPLVVAAEVTPGANGEAEAKVVKVFKDEARSRRPQPLPGTVTVRWEGSFTYPGHSTYLLALSPVPGGTAYEVTPLFVHRTRENPADARVYPYTDSVRIQAEQILAR